ncbi:MAG TPA: phage portal protein [Acidobacteria bacterium]|nr:phage portal protein [Acidobacteriota bacterium]
MAAVILDLNGHPIRPEASFGQHVRRSGAHLQGTLVNWANHVVTSRIAEREKRKIGERAEDLYVNSSIAHAVIEGLNIETVGTGLTPTPTPDFEALGRDEAWSDKYASAIWRLFKAWAFDPRKWCDATRRASFYQLEVLAYFQWKLHGIGLFQVRIEPATPLRPSRLSLLPICPTRLQTPNKKTKAEIYDGVEVDPRTGAVRAVHIAKKTASPHLRLVGDTQRVPVWHEQTGLPQVLLVADVRNIAEYRQDSILAPVIAEIKNNDDFVEAALVKAVTQNLIALYVALQYPDGSTMSPPPASGAIDWSERVHEIAKGTIIEGPPGYKPEPVQNTAPGPGYDVMWRSIISRVGAATQRGSENILREYNSSYSASQASIENADRFADYDRMVLVGTFCQPAWAWLCYEAVLAGRLPVESRADFLENLHAYTEADWLPPPARRIDKKKEAEHDQKRLATNTTTYADIHGRMGRHWKAALRQRARELAYMRELEAEFGVDMGGASVPDAQAAEPKPEPEPQPAQEGTDEA